MREMLKTSDLHTVVVLQFWAILSCFFHFKKYISDADSIINAVLELKLMKGFQQFPGFTNLKLFMFLGINFEKIQKKQFAVY